MEKLINPATPDVYHTFKPPKGRGCGKSRTPKKTYVVSGLSRSGGSPIERFVVDPIIQWPMWGHGTEILPGAHGFNNLIVYVGADPGGGPGYPNIWDFIEEVRNFGASRAVNPNLDFSLLTPRHWDSDVNGGEGGMVGSEMVFIHRRARYYAPYELNYNHAPLYDCRWGKTFGVTQWAGGDRWLDTIPGYHFSDGGVDQVMECTYGVRDLAFFTHRDNGQLRYDLLSELPLFHVDQPSFSYTGRRPLAPLEEGEYAPDAWDIGIFLRLPITGVEFFKEADKESANRAQEAGFPVAVLEY